MSHTPLARASSADTTTVWGPVKWVKGTSSPTNYTDTFSPDTIRGQRFVLEIWNTSCTAVTAVVDSQQWVGSSEIGSSTTKTVRTLDIGQTGSHTITIALSGTPTTNYIWARLVRVREPSFVVCPDVYFVRPSSITTQVAYFDAPTGPTQYSMRVINGLPIGTNRTTSGTLWLNDTVKPVVYSTGVATSTFNVSVASDGPTNAISFKNTGAANTRIKVRVTAVDNSAPVLTFTQPTTTDTLFTKSAVVYFTGSVADETPGWLTITETTPWLTQTSRPLVATPGAFSDSVTGLSEGRHRFRVQVTNSAKLTTTQEFWVVRDVTAPELSVSSPSATSPPDSTTSLASITVTGTWSDSTSVSVLVDDALASSGYARNFSITYALDIGTNRIRIMAVDKLGNTTSTIRYYMRLTGTERGGQTLAASTLSATAIPPFYDEVRFLWSAGDITQRSVDTTAFVPSQLGVIRGHVIGRDYGPMANVTVRVMAHPEYGYTQTRNDGTFDLAVNGGQQYTLRFTATSYLESQRKVMVPQSDFAILDEDVALVGVTARYTDVTLDAPVVAHSRFASDANGDRDMRFVFRPGMRARVVKSLGDTITFPKIRLRATEFTAGSDGRASMPGELPPTTAYTYCIDVRTDQADSLAALQGKTELTTMLTDTVACYIKNFLHLPVGTWMPLGYYDRDRGVWVGDQDGVIMKIIGISSGHFVVDTNGDTLADSQVRLDSLGITTNELTQLIGQYAVGDTVWRMRMTHFSAPDANCNFGLLALMSRYGSRAWQFFLRLINPCLQQNASTIECESHVLKERIPVPGTPFSLNYRSDRAPGDLESRTLHFRLFQGAPPPDLARVIVRLDIAGRRIETTVNNPTASSEVTLAWNGTDGYGRTVTGSRYGRLSVGYQYKMYYQSGAGGASYANPGKSAALPPSRTGGDRDLGLADWSFQQVLLGGADAASDGLGGWSLSCHHVFDPKGAGTVWYGDGTMLPGERLPLLMWHVAGRGDPDCGGPYPTCDDALPAASVQLLNGGMARGPDGSLYISDNQRGSIYRLGSDGYLHRIAGTGARGGVASFGPEGPATSCVLHKFKDMAIGPDGTLYFATARDDAAGGADNSNIMICAVSPQGMLRKIMGIGDPNTYDGNESGDGGPVGAARMTMTPTALACGPEGSVYVTGYDISSIDMHIRRITPDGYIYRYAGGGDSALTVTPVRAIHTKIAAISSMIADPNGTLYWLTPGGGGNGNAVARITTDGAASLVLPSGNTGGPRGIGFAPEGGLYLSQSGGNAGGVFHMDADGRLSQIAGFETIPAVHGGRALGVGLGNAGRIVSNPDGSFYLEAGVSSSIVWLLSRRMASASGTQFNIPTADGSAIDEFDLSGRHLRTRDALTGAVRYSFRYDAGGTLVSVYDVNGDSTVITRSAPGGSPLTITGPFSQTTTLGMSGPYLGSASFHGEQVSLQTYQPGTSQNGLLYQLTEAEPSRVHNYHYEAATGRLDIDTDPETHALTLDATTVDLTSQTWHTALRTSLGRATIYDITSYYDGSLWRRVTGPDGFRTVQVDSVDGTLLVETQDGRRQNAHMTPDPRLGILAQYPSTLRDSLPSGNLRKISMSRSYTGGFNPPTVNGTWTESVSSNGRNPVTRRFTKSGGSVDTFTVTSPLGRITRLAVDAAGRPKALLLPDVAPISYTLDAHGRVVATKQVRRGWSYGYDNLGRLTTVRDTLQRMTQFGYDDFDRDTLWKLPGGRAVGFRYNHVGDLLNIHPPGQPLHEFAYTKTALDQRYMPPAVTGLDSTATRFEFNSDRQLTRVMRPDGNVVSYSYDGTKGRLDSIAVARGRYTHGYSTLTGQLLSVLSPDSVLSSYEYDGPLVKKETWAGKIPGAQERSVARVFDHDFRDSVESVTGAPDAGFGYDADGLLTSAGPLGIERRAVDGAIHSTSVSAGGGNMSNSAGYDPDYGELDSLTYTHSSQGTLFQQTVERDDIGRVMHVTEQAFGTAREWRYRYDDAGRLYGALLGVGGATPETLATYGYDNNGNRTRVVHFSSNVPTTTDVAQYDAQDRLTSFGTTTYQYTAAGQLLRRIATGGDTTAYVYDALGALIKVRFQNGDTLTYVVDGANRRVGRMWNGSWTGGWLYENALRPAAELDASGSVLNRYVYGANDLSPSLILRGGVTYRVITDYLGSVRGAVNVATGTAAQRRVYDPWGAVIDSAGLGFQALGYAGGLEDVSTGLTRFGARDYLSIAGRWTTPDDNGAGVARANCFSYALNTPVAWIDVDGHSARPPAGSEFFRHQYNEKQTLQLLQWTSEDARGPSWAGYVAASNNHSNPGYMDFKNREDFATFEVDGHTMNAGQFGNFSAAVAGYEFAGEFGVGLVEIAGVVYDIAEKGWHTDVDASSRPAIWAGCEWARTHHKGR